MTLMTRAQWFAHNNPVLGRFLGKDEKPDTQLIGLLNQVADYAERVGVLRPAVAAQAIPGGVTTALPDDRYGPDGYLTPAALIRGFIGAHEGGLSMDPRDHGNFYPAGVLIGSKYGVTGAALAAHREAVGDPEPVNKQTMALLTLEEAVEVGLRGYYQQPGFDKLPWNRVTMSAVDMGWGAGPRQATKLLQRMVGTVADGQIGGATIAAFAACIAREGEEGAARSFGAVRDRFYESLNQPRFLKGWKNRTASFLPGATWWREARR